LAGGVRRPEDQPYYDQCVQLIDSLGLKDRVKITGFIPTDGMDSFFDSCKLVLAPFRATSGSGSLAQALARGTPILASDLLLNREIVERQPGALSFFKSLDPVDCARKVCELLDRDELRIGLQEAAKKYAERLKPARVAEKHSEFYLKLIT
jgi:glycosyltransferase involved in cell wall biosynthesis